MGIYPRPPFWWMLLEGHDRRRESTGIRCDASSPAVREANRRHAEDIYHARMLQLARQRVGLPTVSETTFQAFSTWYEAHHTSMVRAPERERVILGHLRGTFGRRRLAEITPALWAEYATARTRAGIARSTIGRELAVMKALLSAAVGVHVDANPLAGVARPVVVLPAKRTLSKADDVRLLAELHDDEIRDLYQLGVGTLLRQMNLVMLQRKHWRAPTLVVLTKTGAHQMTLTGPTPLQTRAATVLARRLPKTHDGYFFPKWQARFAKDRNGANAKFLQAFRRACRRADIPWGLANHGVVWHTATRASGATRMLREYGIDLRTVQLLGGWRSLDQMAAYLGVDLSVGARQVHTRSAKGAM